MGNIDTIRKVVKEQKAKRGPNSGPGSLAWIHLFDYVFYPQLLTKHDDLILLTPEHLLPPFLACVTIRLVPYLTPYPQFLEHRPHLQDDQRQFTEIK